jgi:hypothetical protein
MQIKKELVTKARGANVEDWSAKNEDRLLEEQVEYSSQLMNQQAAGSPDFTKKLSVRLNRNY